MAYDRFAVGDDNVVVKGNYDSDGIFIGKQKDLTMRHLTNYFPSPVIAELVDLASKHTGLHACFRKGDQTYDEMDAADAAESHDVGYNPDNEGGSIWTSTAPGADMSAFWNELQRLESLVKTPLDEPVLKDDFIVVGGYMYIVDGKLTECEHFNGESNKGITVAEFKRRYGFQEVKRCDLNGRQLRLPERKERAPANTLAHRWKSDGRTIRQAKRRPRSSNKIKKVK